MFAPRRVRGGDLTWEACQNICGDNLAAAFPNVANVYDVMCQGDTFEWYTNYAVCIPGNLTRGVVCLRRCHLWLTAEIPQIATVGIRRHAQPMLASLQLAPVRLDPVTGNANVSDVLSMRNAGDIESPRILWRELLLPRWFTDDGTTRVAWIGSHKHAYDIKTMRRFAREQWALILTVDYEHGVFGDGGTHDSRWYIDMRMLFSAYDAL